MKIMRFILLSLICILVCVGCSENENEQNVSSKPTDVTCSTPAATSKPVSPTSSTPIDFCAKGHTFPNGSTACVYCGIDYFCTTLKFELNEESTAYIVTGIGTCDRTEVIIPAVYNGLPVTEIGKYAFSSLDAPQGGLLTKVTIPDSVTRVGSSAFLMCESLTEVRLPENLTYIGDSAFQMCSNLTEIRIPEKVTRLEAYTFSACTRLQRVTLHDGITMVGEALFELCESLKSIYIPKVTVIPDFFAANCVSLERVEISRETVSIGVDAFVECKSLTSINLGSKLETVAAGAFTNCASLAEVTLPDSTKRVGANAFANCISLRRLTIPHGLELVGNTIAVGCEQLEYNIYQGMQYLGDEKNPYLILMGRSDASQKHLIVHEDTRFIPDNKIFYGSDIQSIYIGKSVECIYGWSEKDNRVGVPFSNMDALEKIEVSPENKTYHASGNCLIETAAKSLVQGCKNSVIPDDGSVEIIYGFSFQYQDGLVSLVIPNSVKAIGNAAFRDCTNLKWLVIGTGVKDIANEILWEVSDVTVYYMGTAKDWEKIRIVGINVNVSGFVSNNYLKKAPRYYYSETAPTEPGNYWHYVDGKPTPWESEE